MAVYDIDTLQIEIGATSTGAVAQLEALTASLRKVRTAAKGCATRLGEVVARETELAGGAAAGTAAATEQARQLAAANGTLAASNTKVAKSFGAFAKISIAYMILRRVANAMSNWITSSNEYIENVNLFQVSMGEYYDQAFEYAQLVNKKLGIDPSEWMRNQGVFMSMAKGFGLANEKAYQLSKGLNELTYDISSLYNEDIETAAKRLQSALAGEIEPIRRLGISISKATLEEFALSKGITESVASMTEQEKALLRGVKLMEDAKRIGAIGDFAKTLESPANAIRVLKQQVTQLGRALGNVLIPVLTQVIPYVQAFVMVLTEAISKFALVVGFEMPQWDTSSWENGGDVLEDAEESAKELKKQLMGIDELTILSDNSNGNGSGSVSDWVNNLDIPELWNEDMLNEINSKAEQFKEQMKDILDLALNIGIALAAWKISAGVVNFFSSLSTNKGMKIGLGITLLVTAVTIGFRSGYNFGYDGGTWKDFVGILLSPVAGALGGALIGSAILPGVGTAVGAVIGFTVAFVATVVGIFKGEKQGIIDRFYASDVGKEILELKERIGEIAIEFRGISGAISDDDYANLTVARDLLNEIFSSYGRENLTKDEIQEIITKIEVFNELGLTDITYEFDGVRLVINETNEELNSLLDNMEKQMKLEALKEGYIQKYKLLAEAEHKLSKMEAARQKLLDEYSAKESLKKALGEELEALKMEQAALYELKNPTEAQMDRYAEVSELIQICRSSMEDLNTEMIDLSKEIEIANGVVEEHARVVGELEKEFNDYRDLYLSVARDVVRANEEIRKSLNDVNEQMKTLTDPKGLMGGKPGIKIEFGPGYASGGFPEHGEMFLANEAGPEMVGRIGRRTAVANSDQIVSAVAGGVQSANNGVISAIYAMSRQIVSAVESSGGDIYMDGQMVGARTTRAQNRMNRMYGKTLQNT